MRCLLHATADDISQNVCYTARNKPKITCPEQVMDHFIDIYARQAAKYHQMMLLEDVDGNLLPAIEQVIPLTGKRILDLGTGTGRLPLLFGDQPAAVIGLDLHGDMLREQMRQSTPAAALIQADMQHLPVVDRWAELVTAGWALGHFTGWYPETWKQRMATVLDEMHRVTAVGGNLLILETLSTGSTKPAPPTPALADYYGWIEGEWGFSRQEIQTDFLFSTVAEAVGHTEFFFGESLSALIRQNNWSRLPEWTGIWHKSL
jgi:ubiquinone/menaquinone biosynthesis C-methylase UbiE